MALVAGDLIEQARSEHPSFTPQLAPMRVCVRFVNEGQRRLVKKIHATDATYLTQRWIIKLLAGQNVAQVGAGLTGEAPLEIGAIALDRRLVDTGAAALVDVEDTAILVAERVVTVGTLTTVQASGVAWTVNEFVGAALQIVSGLGAGQVREIASNTADTATIDPLEPFLTAPDTTSTFIIRDMTTEADGSHGALLGEQPNRQTKHTFLVRLDSLGQPYLDLSAPINVEMSLGIPLPPAQGFLDGSVHFNNDAQYADGASPLTFIPMNARYSPPGHYCAAIEGRKLFLAAPFEQWSRVDRLEIPFIPNPPAITAAEDFLFLPDDAEDALVGAVIQGMARRAEAMNTAGPGINDVKRRAKEAEDDYLTLVTGFGRAISDRIEEVY